MIDGNIMSKFIGKHYIVRIYKDIWKEYPSCVLSIPLLFYTTNTKESYFCLIILFPTGLKPHLLIFLCINHDKHRIFYTILI